MMIEQQLPPPVPPLDSTVIAAQDIAANTNDSSEQPIRSDKNEVSAETSEVILERNTEDEVTKSKSKKKRGVGIVKLDKETKTIVERFTSVARAAKSIGVTYKQLYGAASFHNIMHDHYWYLIDADLTDEEIDNIVK